MRRACPCGATLDPDGNCRQGFRPGVKGAGHPHCQSRLRLPAGAIVSFIRLQYAYFALIPTVTDIFKLIFPCGAAEAGIALRIASLPQASL